MKLHKLRLEIW